MDAKQLSRFLPKPKSGKKSANLRATVCGVEAVEFLRKERFYVLFL